MKLAPAVIVHGLGMAQAALAVGRPVTLLSAEGAGVYAGVGWWRALVAAARAAQPGCLCQDILDCGAAPGRVLEALRAGQTTLILRAEPRIWTDLAERTRHCGGVLWAEAPPALDLGARGAPRLLDAWLSQGGCVGG
jgi:hypothetical protein